MRSDGLPVNAHLPLVRHMTCLHLDDYQRHHSNRLCVLVAEFSECFYRGRRRRRPCGAHNCMIRVR